MADGAAWEPIEHLLRTAEEAGFRDVTRNQLRRWQRAGVLPRPKQRHLGRGRGTDVLYPPGSARQLVALCEQLAMKRSLIDACWVLWWDGYPVAEASIRVLFNAKATQLEHLKAMHERGELDNPVEELARGRLPHPALRVMRKQVRSGDISLAFSQLLEFSLGNFDAFAGDVADAVAKASDLADAEDLEKQLRATSPAYNPRKLREALDASSLEDLEAARDSLRAVLAFPEGLIAMFQAETGHAMPLSFKIPLKRLNLEEGLYLVLLWLSVSRSPWMREVSEAFTSLVRAVAKGLVPAADALETEVPLERNDRAKEEPPSA